jgi:catecholate siderophore receptor
VKNRVHRSSARPARRKGRARLFMLSATVATSALAVKPALAAPQSTGDGRAVLSSAPVLFSIAAGSLEIVLAEFERITGVKAVLSMPELGMIQSPGVSGRLTPAAAMTALLQGTSVQATFSDGRFNLGVDQVREFVEVSGRTAPATVSSPRYTAPARDIPQTIAIIPKAVIEAQGATTLSDALRNVPGITIQAGEGGGASNTAGDMFNMRGFNASNSLFVDGVRDDGLISRDVFNLEQVEVFMGPTGSDVGRGTAAGYVNMQTKTPHLGAAYGASVGYASGDRHRTTVDANFAPSMTAAGGWWSKTALRVNALWQDGGVPGRDIVESETKAVAPSLGFGLGTRTRLTVGGQFVRQENVPDYGIPGAAWAETPLAPTTLRATQPVDQTNFYGSASHDYDDAAQDSFTVRAEHDVNRRLQLRFQSRYNRTTREAVISTIQNPAAFDAATGLVTIARQGNERHNEVTSHQFSLIDRFSTGRLRHAISAGVDVNLENQFAPGLTGLGTRAPVNLYQPNPFDPILNYAPTRSLASSRGETTTAGLFAFDTVELGSRWQLSGGARIEHYDTSFMNVDVAGVTTADLTGSDVLLSGKAGVVFRAAETGNLYVSFGSSVTPPGTANFTLSAQANNQNNPSVKPQESTNFEVGTKWDFFGTRLSLTGAAFRTLNENVIFTVDAAAIPPVYNQDDRQLVKGVTGGIAGQVTERWTVLFSAGYLDATQDTQNAANNGKRLVLTPKVSGSLWSTYRLPGNLTLGGGLRFTGDVFINAANTIMSPGYKVVDGLAEYAVNSHFTLRLNLYNLTDELYIRSVNNNGGRYNPGYPRSAMFSSDVRF